MYNNKYVKIWTFGFIIGIILTLFLIYWHKWFPKGTELDVSAVITLVGVVGGALGIIWSTNKQIKNSNKEANRPRLSTNELEKGEIVLFEEIGDTIKTNIEVNSILGKIFYFDKYPAYQYDKKRKTHIFTRHEPKLYIEFDIDVINDGNGIANNISLLGITNNIRKGVSISEALNAGNTNHYVIQQTLPSNNKTKVEIKILCGDMLYYNSLIKTDGKLQFILWYTDIYKNAYAEIIEVTIYSDEIYDVNFYGEGTVKFYDTIKDCRLKYNKLKNQYLNKIYK